MKSIFLSIIWILISSVTLYAGSTVNIAFINMDKAVNSSEAGQRSMKTIRAKVEQLKAALSQKREELVKKENELKNSMMLSADAKKRKEEEFFLLVNKFKKDEAKANEEIRQQEQRHLRNIYEDLKDIISKVARKNKIDLVLETRTILYSKDEWKDITALVVKEYDSIQKIK